MAQPVPLAVFVSGGGTNLGALLDRFGRDGRPDSAARVALVVSDRPGVGALDRAESAGVPSRVIDPAEHTESDFERALSGALREHGIELVALAGYLRLVPPAVVQEFRGRIVNIHPAPLPAFGGKGLYGARAHRAVLEAGVRVTGPTVHFVDERYDTGPIIAQWPVPVLPGDTVEILAGRVLRYEHRLYPAVIHALARGRVRMSEDGRAEFAGGAEEGRGFELVPESRALADAEVHGVIL